MPVKRAHPTSDKAGLLKGIEEDWLEELPDVTRAILDTAKGALITVELDAHAPADATFIGDGTVVPNGGDTRKRGAARKPCPTCGMCRSDQLPKGRRIKVYQLPPDKTQARYIHEHLAGKAKAKEDRQIDPVINVVFGPIDTVWDTHTQVERVEMERAQAPEPLPVGI